MFHVRLQEEKYLSEYAEAAYFHLWSQLISLKAVDTFGTLSEEYIENGFLISKARGKNIVLTQNDIRQLQLAISAIKSGIQILLSEYNASASDIDKVYISGSFGRCA